MSSSKFGKVLLVVSCCLILNTFQSPIKCKRKNSFLPRMWWRTICHKYGPNKVHLWREEHNYDHELDKYHDVIKKSIAKSNITLRGIRQRDYLSLLADAYLILYEVKGELNHQLDTIEVWLFELCNDSGDTDFPNWKSQVLTKGLNEDYHILIE